MVVPAHAGREGAAVQDQVVYKTLIFDLGKVLVHFDFNLGYQAFEKHCPHKADEIRAIVRARGVETIRRFETGLIEPADFQQAICEMLDMDADYDGFCSSWSSIFRQELIPESTIAALSKRYRLVLLSNTNAIHFDLVNRKYPALRYFHHLVLSHEVKAMKPDPAIYREAIAHAHCLPEECFYADDIEENIIAGRKLGLDGVVFESREQIEEAMRARGIEW